MSAGYYNNFLGHLKATGVAKVSHFEFILGSVPAVNTEKNNRLMGYQNALSFRCEAAELPGRQLGTQDIRVYGPSYKIPHQSVYQEITLNFLETSTFMVRDFFESWLNAIWNSETNTLNYAEDWEVDAKITQYDMVSSRRTVNQTNEGAPHQPRLEKIMTWNLRRAYPTAVNQMPVAWSDDGLHRVAVTFTYQYYELSTPKKTAARNTVP